MNESLPEKLERLIQEYSQKIDLGESLGLAVADAENEYRLELSKFLAEEVLAGKKVSVLGDIARGKPHIAALRKEKQKYEAMLEANKNRIFALNKEIYLTELQLKLEYGKVY